MPDHTREDAIRVAGELGWTVVGRSGKGYLKLHCPCGKHKKWLKKTPSDPNFFKNAIKYMRRQDCSAGGEIVPIGADPAEGAKEGRPPRKGNRRP